MKVCFLTTRPRKASARYRFVQYIDLLKEDGIDCEVKKIEKSFLKRLAMYKGLANYDIVFLQRRLLNILDLYFLRKNAKRLVFDYDDAIMYKDSSSNNIESPRRMKRFMNTLLACDTIICGNSYLKDLAGDYKDKAVVIPTVLDTGQYSVKSDYKGTGKIRLGWIGSKKTIFYLKDLEGIFKRLKKGGLDFELLVISDEFIDIEGVEVVKKKWSEETEKDDLRSIDIGLMPIRNDLWSRGKCGFKILQYMAAGATPVASSVGANKEIIIEGETGCLAASDDDWVKAIKKLSDDEGLRQRLGQASRQRVDSEYSLKARYKDFKKALMGEGL